MLVLVDALVVPVKSIQAIGALPVRGVKGPTTLCPLTRLLGLNLKLLTAHKAIDCHRPLLIDSVCATAHPAALMHN